MVKFEKIIEAFGLPVPVAEYVFCKGRKFRFDYAWIEQKVALEVDGGTFKITKYKDKNGIIRTHRGGRHNTGKGFLNDCEKFNTAASMGWRILRTTPKELTSGKTIELIKKTLEL
jgi:very-short-patch-repair endonuclease